MQLMKRLSFGKKYYLEKLIARHEKEKTLPYYVKKNYMNSEFFKRGETTNRKVRNFLDGLDFLNKELKKSPSLQ